MSSEPEQRQVERLRHPRLMLTQRSNPMGVAAAAPGTPFRTPPPAPRPPATPCALRPQAEPVEIKIDHRRGVKREHLAHHQPAHDHNAERLAPLAPLPAHERARG